MSSEEQPTFETAQAGASLTYPCTAGALKQGGHALLKGKPCKIISIAISKTGKHGHAKAAMVGIDIFTGKKYEDMCPCGHNMEVPNIAKMEYQLLDLDEDNATVSVLMENGDTKDDLNLPKDTSGNYEEEAQKIIDAFNDGKTLTVTVCAAMEQEKIVSFKEILEK